MKIDNDFICFEFVSLYIGMPFEEVLWFLASEIIIQEPSCLILKDEEFYGLKGRCIIKFKNGGIEHIHIAPNMKLYDLYTDGRLMTSDEAVCFVRETVEKELTHCFGLPVGHSADDGVIFKAGSLLISVSNNGVVIR